MSFTLYGDYGSGAFSAEAALAEAGAPYSFELVSLEKNEQKAPAFLAINPSGKMPALRLGEGQVVTESAAILLTIADNFPGAHLLPPQGSPERATAYRWLLFMAGEIYPFVEMVDYPERFAPEGTAAAAIRDVARARVRERLLLVERIARGPFILPSGFSLLDIYAAMFSRWKGTLGLEWRDANLPLLGALSQKVSQRPAIASVWERHFEPKPN
jgi:glutathione S-transferase